MLSKRIREFRKKIGMTQGQLSEAVNITRGKIGKLETDRQDVDSELLIGLSERFGINIHWLVTGQGEMFFDDRSISDREKELEIENRVLREMLSLPATKNKKTA